MLKEASGLERIDHLLKKGWHFFFLLRTMYTTQ
jgi:hypothetical protein